MSKNFSFDHRQLRIGFLLNPYAGLGGPQGMKGSDALAADPTKLDAGVERRSAKRAMQFFQALTVKENVVFVFDRGVMGFDSLQAMDFASHDFTYQCIDGQFPDHTRAEHSQMLCQKLLAENIDVLVFVGGDGTARDVCRAVGSQFPVLGIPAGVKMHSGVFAISPSAAAQVINALALGELISVDTEEVRDIDEDAFQKGIVRSRHFGEMLVPQELRFIQHVKQGGVEVDELVLLDIAQDIEERIHHESDALFIFAPGSTTHFVLEYLCGSAQALKSTLLGVDVFDGTQIIAKDINATQLENITAAHQGKIYLILTAIGGQGHIIGRGNQQISPNVLRRVGRENLWLIATKTKLQALDARPLIIDSSDDELDLHWQGLIPVITGFRDTVLYRVGHAELDSDT
ncbi:hypothetical protein TDB9533_02379 [Thalassocella blandensis]|nr:hypothetical protein TDB9533_02379 [Thalassocella blandensis]